MTYGGAPFGSASFGGGSYTVVSITFEIRRFTNRLWKRWRAWFMRDLVRISADSAEYLQSTVQTTEDPTSSTVRFAFMGEDEEPGDDDWVSAAWEGAAVAVSGGYYQATAQLLIGTGGEVLPEARYDVWIELDTGEDELPIFYVGDLRVH